MELNNQNLKQAKEELEAICKKYDITLMPVVVHQGDRTFSSIEIVPRQALQQSQQASVTSEEAPKAE
jgi:hypothetical protein